MAQIKVIHTSDWHLGKRLFRKEREEEHSLFLNWLEKTLKEQHAHVLLLAGDVFDSPTPPHSSLKLYYDFLKRVSDLGVQVVIISGNHDSQGLIRAPESLLRDKNIILHSKIETQVEKNVVKLKVEGTEAWVKCMPYFRNFELIKLAQENGLFDEQAPREEVFKKALNLFIRNWPEGNPAAKILLSHHVFGNYSPTGSEHFIGLTGIESIPTEMLKGTCDYAALGHIHKFQRLTSEPETVYTGSPIQMRFSEKKTKYINSIVFDTESASVETEKIQIPVFRQLIQVKTNSASYIEDIKDKLREQESVLAPFVEVQMEMQEAKTGLVEIIKEVCEQKGAELLSFLPIIKNADTGEKQKIDMSELDILQLFRRFYSEKFPEQEDIPSHLESHFKTLLSESIAEEEQ